MVARVSAISLHQRWGWKRSGWTWAVAGEDCAHQRHDAGVDVIERQWIVDALLADTDVGQPPSAAYQAPEATS